MGDGRIEQWHAEAHERWPHIAWPLARFLTHVGESTPAHPHDLYIGGAAGWRVTPAWIELNASFAPKVRSVFRRLPTADMDEDELWSEVVAKLMEDHPEQEPDTDSGVRPCRLVSYRGDAALVNFLILVGRRIAISKARSTKPEVGGQAFEAAEASIGTNGTPRPGTIREDREMFDAALATLRGALEGVPSEARAVFLLAKGHGVKQSTIAKRLGWSEAKVSRKITLATERLAEAISSDRKLDGFVPSAEAWEQIWRLCVDRMQAMGASGVSDADRPPMES